MVDIAHLVWLASIVVLSLVLLVLVEIHRINYRRQNEVMYGSEDFDAKVKEFHFTPKEVGTLEKLVRFSHFENKDAVLNSSDLFERAVNDFYDVHNVFSVDVETLNAISSIREKMDFSGLNPLTNICSSRQFVEGNRVDVTLHNGRLVKGSSILWRTEREWGIAYDGSFGPGPSLVGRTINIRWTRLGDAVYTVKLDVHRATDTELIVWHTMLLEKQQLRRWVREEVRFPVHATFADGSFCDGVLYDLSAGGILLGLPREVPSGEHINIEFELPSFGTENVEIEILRTLGHKNPVFPDYYSLTASFAGAFGWTQERVLQYIFEVHKYQNLAKKEAGTP